MFPTRLCKCKRLALSVMLSALFAVVGTSVVNHSLAQGECVVQITPYFTEYYGDAILDGASAPIGTLIEASNSDDLQTGCFIVNVPGSYGYMRVYGADSDTGIPGMGSNEQVIFKVNGTLAGTMPVEVLWSNDKGQHQVDLNAVSGPDAVDDLNINIAGGNVELSWSDVGGIVNHYDVWRSPTPYFTPGDADTEKIAPSVAPNPGGTVNYLDTTHHLTEPGTNDYYKVLAKDGSNNASAGSNGVAAFDFALVPGDLPPES